MTGGWADGWTGGWTGGLICGWTDGWTGGWAGGLICGWTGGWTGGWRSFQTAFKFVKVYVRRVRQVNFTYTLDYLRLLHGTRYLLVRADIW